eukprot:tig00020557_g11124.t1
MATAALASGDAGDDAGPESREAPEFILLRRSACSWEDTVQASFQAYAPHPPNLWSLERCAGEDPDGLYAHYPYVLRCRKYKLKAAAGSSWMGRQIVLELARWGAKKALKEHTCPEAFSSSKQDKRPRLCFPFVSAASVVTRVDALGETEAFAMDSCRCFKGAAFELRIRDAATGERPRGRIMVYLVIKLPARRRDGGGIAEIGPHSLPGTPFTAPAPYPPLPAKHAGGGPVPPNPKRPRAPAGSDFESASEGEEGRSAPGRPAPPEPSFLSPRDPNPDPEEAALLGLEGAGFAYPRPPQDAPSGDARPIDIVSASASAASSSSASASLLASLEAKFWDLLLRLESRALAPPARPDAGPAAARVVGDVEELFVKLSNLSVDPDAPAPVYVSRPSPPPPLPPLPDPDLPASPAPLRFSPAPYLLEPHEEEEFMRRVGEAEDAGAASALAVLLGDPRVLGTPLLRTTAGRIRTRHLLQLIRVNAGASCPGRPRVFFPPAPRPLEFPSREETERACQNVWNFVLLATSDYVLLSPDFSLLPFEEVPRPAPPRPAPAPAPPRLTAPVPDPGPGRPGPRRARASDDQLTMYRFVRSSSRCTSARSTLRRGPPRASGGRRGPSSSPSKPGQAFPHTTPPPPRLSPSARAAFTLRQYGHLRAALELQFEAWDTLLRLRVYPHRLESEVLRELCELHVQIGRVDLARHFAEKLYWFEETEDDVEAKVTCLQTLGYIEWYDGDAAAGAEIYSRGVETGRELVERSGGNPAYALRMGRCSRIFALCQFASGLVSRWGRSYYAGAKVVDETCEVTSGDHDEFGILACGIVFTPEGFKLRHAIRILRAALLHLEWSNRRSRTPHKSASALYHIGLMCALDGQLEEALELFSGAAARYACTPELAASFPDSHPRIRNLRRAAACVAARLRRPLPPELASAPAAGHDPHRAARGQRPRGLGLRLVPAPNADQADWTSRGVPVDPELRAVITSTYPAETVAQISAWLADGPA